MRSRILIEKLRNQFWALPALIIAILLCVFMLALQAPQYRTENFFLSLFLQGGSAEGARLILNSIATATMTVIGVVFSLSIVVLQQASTQHSPRVVETFAQSYMSQSVFGFLVGTFAYSLLLLRQIHGDTQTYSELPQVAISIAILLVLVCTVLLILYMNHLSHSIRSTTIISRIENTTISYLRDYNAELNRHRHPVNLKDRMKPSFEIQVNGHSSGYLQSIDYESLQTFMPQSSWVIEFCILPGDYIDLQAPIAKVYSEKSLAPEQVSFIEKSFTIGSFRTHSQDPKYGLRQLVDIALRALSPGINDPTTAIESLHRIGTLLRYYSLYCDIPREIFLGSLGCIRIPSLELRDLLDLSFLEILRFSESHPRIRGRIQEILSLLLSASPKAEHRQQTRDFIAQNGLKAHEL